MDNGSPVACSSLWALSETPFAIPEKAQWGHIIVEAYHLQPPCACETFLLHHKITFALKDVIMQRQLDRGPFVPYVLRLGELSLLPLRTNDGSETTSMITRKSI
jgi:hypothetical protein